MQPFAYDEFETFKVDATMRGLVDFHRTHKFLLLAKDEKIYRKLGNLVGNHDNKEFTELLREYELLFKSAIAKKSSAGKTRNALEHMAGFLKTYMDKKEKAILHEQIQDCALKNEPMSIVLNTLKVYATKYKVDYLLEQTLLNPYPKELGPHSNIDSPK